MDPLLRNRPPPQQRLIALGASNLTRMLPTLVRVARQRASGPIDVRAALGFGRSYGVRSRFLFRRLSGIDRCGLWDGLAGAPTPKVAVGLLMDLGNDILYGVEVPQIVAWVDLALARLRGQVDRLLVAGLPVHEVARVGPLRYGLVRTLLVPSCRVPRLEALRRAEQLDDALRRRAAAHDAAFVEMRREWYGFDPIHVRPRCFPAVAERLLGPGEASGPLSSSPGPVQRVADWCRLRAARPEVRQLFGAERHRRQPSALLADGTTVSLY